jgi:5-methyltetrahydropteroyltriglutamate--homocysteine methyltransferase
MPRQQGAPQLGSSDEVLVAGTLRRQLECDDIMNEGDMSPKYEGLLRNQQLAIGVADVLDLNVEPPYTLVERINEWVGSWLPPEQTLITSSCGMNHLSQKVAFGKLAAMVEPGTSCVVS